MIKLHRSIFARLMAYSIAFAICVLTALTSGIVMMSSITADSRQLNEKWLGGATLLGQIDFELSSFRLSEAYRALFPSRDGRKVAEQLSEYRRERINQLLAQYSAALGRHAPPQIVDFTTNWVLYQSEHDAWIKADKRGLDEQPAQYLSPLDLQYQTADAAIDRLIEIHREEARERVNQMNVAAKRMLLAACVGGLEVVVLTLVLFIGLRRQIIRPLLKITDAMTRLAGGDRDLNVPEMHRQDEIGRMAAACEVFRVNFLALDRAHEAARLAEEQAQTLARHDALTGLPNRRVFSANLQEALLRAQAGVAFYSVLLIDLDEFKKINDLQGHQIGDFVLCEIGKRLESAMRKNDTVARLGGDEFAIIAEGEVELHEHLEGAKRLAGRLLGAIRLPIKSSECAIEIGASIGIATCRKDASDVSALLRAADIAMYRAKQSGRCTFRFFEQSMDDEMRDREALEKDIVRAIEQGEIRPYYQPLVNISQNRIRGFEALARWQHPVRGYVPPDVFIPLVEQLGMMTELTNTILRQACRDAANWPDDIRIAVNFSPQEFKDPLLAARVLSIVAQEGLNPARLEVEITETALVSDIDGAKAILRALQSVGITVCLDDFGTGYSSLYHLRELKFDKVKIDRSFVHAMQSNSDSEKIIDAILGLTRSLRLPTVAEGIEDSLALKNLAAKGCEFGQGWYFGKAMAAENALALLREGAGHALPAKDPAGLDAAA